MLRQSLAEVMSLNSCNIWLISLFKADVWLPETSCHQRLQQTNQLLLTSKMKLLPIFFAILVVFNVFLTVTSKDLGDHAIDSSLEPTDISRLNDEELVPLTRSRRGIGGLIVKGAKRAAKSKKVRKVGKAILVLG